MSITVAFAIALAEARSCLAALADGAVDFDESSHFAHSLLDLDLDRLHPIGPGLSPIVGTRAELIDRLEGAADAMIALDGDRLSLELLVDSALFGAADLPCRCQRLESADDPSSTTGRQP